MEKILIFLFIIQICSSMNLTSVPDVTVVYNVNTVSEEEDDHFPVDVEVHSLSNSLGKIFFLDNGTYLSPSSYGAIPSFACINSKEPCQWSLKGSWISTSVGDEVKKIISLPKDLNLTCEDNNGGCQVMCTNSYSGPVCSCPTGFLLNADNKTCYTTSSCHSVLTSDEGYFYSPHHSSNYPHNTHCKWLIVTSREKIFQMSISNFRTENGPDYLSVFDGRGQTLGQWTGSPGYISLQTKGNIMLAYFRSDYSVTYHGFKAYYQAETNTELQLQAIQMNSDTGIITTILNVSNSTLCVSVIYLPASSGSLNVTIDQLSGERRNLTHSHKNKINGWIISRFILQNYPDMTDRHVNLTLHLSGKNSKILNVTECTSEDSDVYVLPSVTWTRKNLPKIAQKNTDSKQKCYNGGTYYENLQICVCPIGFTGHNCKEGCGPNRYGAYCTEICSWLESGCRGMIFCNALKSCTCAPGLTGTDCKRECNAGTYGASCFNTCGQCREEFCDIYTGECAACQEGYHPPLCQERYITLRKAPNITERSWYYTTISINFTDVEGKGSPHLYELQYKETEGSEWIKTSYQEIDSKSVVVANATDLKVGTQYLLRVIVISQDGNSYNGSDVPVLKFETLCEVPDSHEYQIQSRDITSSSFAVEWMYPVHSDKWCPINTYELILQERWRKYHQNVSSENTNTVYTNLLPGHQYIVYICAISRKGKAPCSLPFAVSTADKAPGKVRNLIINARHARDIGISWRQPLFTGGNLRGYRIYYQCIKHFMCRDTCKNSNGSLETNETSAHLIKLLPHVQYKITVAAYSANQGPSTEVFTTTKTTIPDASPMASEQPVISKTNTSVTVQWKLPHCFGHNGVLSGYYFTLSSERESGLAVLQTGTTKSMHTNFTGLTPQTEYQVHVYASNSHGWNPEHKLTISFLTSGTVPEAVQDLEVYKKGRRTLGIRWKKPTRVYGDLKSFTVIYYQKNTELQYKETVLPTPCLGWSHLFCHTIDTHLRSDKQYVLTVSARNNEINEDGIPSEVTAITRENAPGAPFSLRILRSTSTSFEMQWGLPYMFNGEIRSFIVNVEHIDSLNDAECCDYFPVQELPFREEMPSYNLEVTGLLPASTYIVSVAAKTITMGPSINATYYTAPLPPTDLQSPQVLSITKDGRSCLLKIQPVEMLSSINSTYLLLVLPPGEKPEPSIWKRDLTEKLANAVNHTFYIVSELPGNEFINEQEVTIGTGAEVRNGTVARLEDPKLSPGVYQVGLALVQAYGGAIGVGVALSNLFEIHALPGA